MTAASPSRIAVLVAAIGLFLASAPAGLAAPFTVTNVNDSGDGSLRQAITSANAAPGADTIAFGRGATGTIALASALPTITDPAGLAINGPGAGALTISGGHAVQVLAVAAGASLSLDRLTVADGGNAGVVAGGGVYNAGTLAVTRSTFSGNRAGCQTPSFGVYDNGGGAIFSSGALTVDNSNFSANLAGCGSAVFNSGTARIIRSTLSGNGGLTNPDSGRGGGLVNTGTLTLVNSTLSGNAAFVFGGGVVNSGVLTVRNSTLSGNGAGISSGGGVFNHASGVLLVADSTLSGNFGDLEGDGGAINNLGTATVTGSTLSGNHSSRIGFGGAVYNFGTLAVTNSTFSGNQAGSGGGAICNAGPGTLTVSFSTLAGNRTIGDPGELGGGGVRAGCFVGQPSTGLTRLVSTVLADNSSGNCSVDSLSDGGYNISSDASCGFSTSSSLASTDPLLGALADNGGPTQTMRLLAGSPAVNGIPAGTNGCGKAVARDQRGVSRPVGAGCDVGAYEDASAPVQLAFLARAVTGVGNGTSLADKVSQIQGDVAANHIASACTDLDGFIAQVGAQRGKKLTAAQATSLIAEARTIETILGC